MPDAATAVLVVATVLSGLDAGVFALYAHTVMPALRRLDDRTFVASFQALDRAIINPWFMVGAFLGAPVSTAVALALLWGDDPALLVAVALMLHVVTVVVTGAVNVPRNDELKAAGDPETVDAASARARFDESRWAAWNLLRVLTSAAALVLLAVALTRTA